MKLQYFTIEGYNQVFKQYEEIIGRKFYFTNEKDNKSKLIHIAKSPHGLGGFDIGFISDVNERLSVYDFMRINDIKYNFYNYDIIAIKNTPLS